MATRAGHVLFLALCASTLRAEVCFEDGAKVNLAAVRGAKVSASKNCITAADLVCRPVHTTEMRFQSKYGAAWWMIAMAVRAAPPQGPNPAMDPGMI